MNLSFYGAAREVTGSCYLIEINSTKFLVDCGLQQGQDEKEDQKFPFNANEIDFVILTHAHIDHSGRLPLLVKEGFNGKIYATKATCSLISIMLIDSAHIQEADALLENKRYKRAGKNEVTPLYTTEDAQNTLKYLIPCNYNEVYNINESIKFNFIDAGHILGSASVELFLSENETNKKIVFSGDIGNKNKPIIRDPQYIKYSDLVIMESTYGNKNHEESMDYALDLATIIDKTLSNGGNVVIPSFAVGRTQDLLYYLREIKERKLIKNNPNFPVYVDSPLASEATKLYSGLLKDYLEYADEATINLIKKGINPLAFSNLFFTDLTEQSKAINNNPIPKVIISSSGMCEAGRIQHHLKHNLWRKESSIIFVGFQAIGTLGRKILDGAKKVEIFGEEIIVNASIYNFSSLSAHAGKDELLEWINNFDKKPSKVFVVHGENSVCLEFTKLLNELSFTAIAPLYKSIYNLINEEVVENGIDILNKKDIQNIKNIKLQNIDNKESKNILIDNNQQVLLDALSKLSNVVHNFKSISKKDINKFAREINKLSNKWSR